MASTKVTFVTGTAEVRRRDPNGHQAFMDHSPGPDQLRPHLTTEPSRPSQVSYVDGKCTCCPYGYHIDLDFLNFCRDLESGSTLRNLKRIQRTKRKLRKSMEVMLDEQDGVVAGPQSAPPDVVHSTEAGRLMHMVNYERSATQRLLSHIDHSVGSTTATHGEVHRFASTSDSDDAAYSPVSPYSRRPLEESVNMTPPSFTTSGRTDSMSSLSSVSTVSSEAAMMHQAHYYQHQQQQYQQFQNSLVQKTTTKVFENPVIEMGTAEMKHFSTSSSAQLVDEPEEKIPPPPPPRTSDVTTLHSVREAMSVSLQRLRELEEQVKTIPILQVRISVLKEEKRLLNLQLKASQATSRMAVATRTVGIGADTVTPKTPPATLPKPVRTVSVGVGDNSVIEPYNLQPHLPTGYTIRENEIHTELYSSTKTVTSHIQPPSLNLSFRHNRSSESSLRESRLSSSGGESPVFTINQIKRSSPKPLTRTVGVGEGNVFDAGMHVHEKEFRTVLMNQGGVAKRNVGIECRVPTRDVGVLFQCDDEKPEMRSVGVNVNYDTSDIVTSFDFRGETELRMALRGVLQRNVHSVGTNCNFKPETADCGTYTNIYSGITVGTGDEDTMRTDVEIRPYTQRRSVGTHAKADTVNRGASTDKGWQMDASTNTSQVERVHRSAMTEKQRQVFAATNTEAIASRSLSNQTEQKMFIALEQIKNAATSTERSSSFSVMTNTEPPRTFDAKSNTEPVRTFSTGVNTTEKVTDLFQKQEEQKTVVTTQLLTQKKPETVHRSEEATKDNEQYSFSETTEVITMPSVLTVEEKILKKGANQASAFLTKSHEVSAASDTTDTKAEVHVDDVGKHYTSYERHRRSRSPHKDDVQNQAVTLSASSSSRETSASSSGSATATSSKSNTGEGGGFQETIVEHYIISKDGKKLISEERTTTSAAGSNHSFKQYSDGQLVEKDGVKKSGSLGSRYSSSYSSGAHDSVDSKAMPAVSEGHISSSYTRGVESSPRSERITSGDYSTSGVKSTNISNQTSKMADISSDGSSSQVVRTSDGYSSGSASTTVYSSTVTSLGGSNYQSSGGSGSSYQSLGGSGSSNQSSGGSNYQSLGGSSYQSSGGSGSSYQSTGGSTYQSSGGSGSIYQTSMERSQAVVTNPYKTVENLSTALSAPEAASTVETSTSSKTRQVSKTSSEGNLYKVQKKSSRGQKMDTIFDMRRTGSVEDFMPDNIRKYMSIDPSNSKDSGFGEDLVSRFSEESSSQTKHSEQGLPYTVKVSKTVTTRRSTKTGDKVSVQETKTVEGEDGKVITTVTKTDRDGTTSVVQSGQDGESEDQAKPSDSSSSSSSRYATFGDNNNRSGLSYSESTMTSVGQGSLASGAETDYISDYSYGSLDRRTGQLKSILKQSKSETDQLNEKRGITFAETVKGGTGSSSEEGVNTSDSDDSTASYDEGSYDSQQGQVVYRCEDDEAIAQGIPGAHMFDQNIRDTYELTSAVRDACNVLATYLQDSTTIQTKELNASQLVVQQEWFQVSSLKLSTDHQVEDFLSSVNEVSKRLLEYIVNMTDPNGNTAIHYCVSHCNFHIASLLLDSEVCAIDRQNKAGYTPIMLAGLAEVNNLGQLEVVRRIFAQGDVNARAATTQQTALMLAASHGRTQMVKLLVEAGADLNAQDVDGSTALMCACEHGHLEIVNFLLAHPSIDAGIMDNENSTALTVAMEAGHKDVGVVLYKHLNFSKPSTSPSLRRSMRFKYLHETTL